MKKKTIKKRRNGSKKKLTRKARLSLAHKSNLDNMKLLVSDKEFQTILSEIRNRLEIPANGFLKEGSELKEWYNKFIEETDSILDSKDFVRQETRIRKKFKSGEISRRIANKQVNLLYEKTPLNFLWQRVEFILAKFKLPLHYREYVKKYIIRGIISAPSHNYTRGPYPPYKKLSEERYIPITIYTRMTKEEINELKGYIDQVSKGLLSHYRLLKNIDRDLEIEEWYENKERMDEVEGTTYKTDDAEIAENLLGSSKKVKNIYDIRRDLKRLRNRRFRFGK